MTRIVASIQPYHTEDFLKYLSKNGWTDLQRSVQVAQTHIELIATSPEGIVHGFRFLNKWNNITTEQIQQSWEKGLMDIYYYVIHKSEIKYKKIDIWIGIFISTDRRILPIKRSNRDSDIGVW